VSGEADDRMIDCERALSRVWAYLDGALSPAEAEELERHLSICSGCDRAHEFERRLLEAVRTGERRRPDPRLTALAERIRAAIRRAPP
jgi:anti-sigma factor (TIGR02949 family)